MNEFYFVRHGQTDANLKGIMCGGKWDLELNSTGLEQAALAAENFKKKVQTINSICVSPLIRARQTAEFFAQKFQLPLIQIDEIQEWDIGAWEKVAFESIKADFLGDGEPPGTGETRKDFQARVQLGFNKCLYYPGPVLMVSHGGVGLALQKFLGTSANKIENCIPFHVYRNAQGNWMAKSI